MRLNKSIMTWLKYLAWTAIAVIIQTAIDSLYQLNLPVYVIPLIASTLKAIATYAVTQKDDCYDDDKTN